MRCCCAHRNPADDRLSCWRGALLQNVFLCWRFLLFTLSSPPQIEVNNLKLCHNFWAHLGGSRCSSPPPPPPNGKVKEVINCGLSLGFTPANLSFCYVPPNCPPKWTPQAPTPHDPLSIIGFCRTFCYSYYGLMLLPQQPYKCCITCSSATNCTAVDNNNDTTSRELANERSKWPLIRTWRKRHIMFPWMRTSYMHSQRVQGTTLKTGTGSKCSGHPKNYWSACCALCERDTHAAYVPPADAECTREERTGLQYLTGKSPPLANHPSQRKALSKMWVGWMHWLWMCWGRSG